MRLGHRRGERDHVVLHLALQSRWMRVDIEAGMLPQQPRRLGRNLAQFGQRLGSRQLHLEPLRETCSRRSRCGPSPGRVYRGII